MDIKSLNLCKCIIVELDPHLKIFEVEDLGDNSTKLVFLSGKQRLFYKRYSIGDIIYAAKTAKSEWKLVTGSDFKRNSYLVNLKAKLDAFFDNL